MDKYLAPKTVPDTNITIRPNAATSFNAATSSNATIDANSMATIGATVKAMGDGVMDDSIMDVSDNAPLARSHQLQQHRYAVDTTQSLLASERTGDIDKHTSINSLAIEAAIAIVINGIHYAVLMASPQQLEYLAIGFLFSEGLIDYRHDLLDWEVTSIKSSADLTNLADKATSKSAGDEFAPLLKQLQDYDVYVIELYLNQRCHQRIQAQKRQLAGRTGCGMCGITGLTQALPDLSAYQRDIAPPPSLDKLLTSLAQLTKAQQAHQLTGAVHAAARFQNGQLQLFEDVGRHNALDKLIGWQLRYPVQAIPIPTFKTTATETPIATATQNTSTQPDYVIMTSRLSIELVQKSIRAQVPWLIGISAPTSTAVRVAERYGLGLAGFLRKDRVTFYTSYPPV